MKSLKSRLKKHEVNITQTSDWSKYDDRLMRAAERGDVEKISATLAKKGVNPSKLDLEGRSAFHIVASKGHLECLNAILLHGVDLTAPDAAGRNALHLSAKYGHSLCLQKLLQFNCPTENVDLQGRTALHDAAMSDCCSCVHLLCDHGACVNAKDGDGGTPLSLATQMCHPAICQLLIEKGAEVNARDKQHRTPLMLGCEYGCKESVEVLLRVGAEVGLVDSLGRDCAYYARIGDNMEILSLIRTAMENSPRGPEHLRSGVYKRTKQVRQNSKSEPSTKSKEQGQDLEVENEDLRDKLLKLQHEQRVLNEKVGGLQMQLSQEQMMSDDLENEREEFKALLEAKEKELEESLKTMENLRGKVRYYEQKNSSVPSSPSTGKEDFVMKQVPLLSANPQLVAHLPARSQLRPLELPGETIDQRQELDTVRRYYEAAREETMRLQQELSRRSSECLALASERDRSKAESDQQIRQLEEALRDVQKRMLDSESKVKQMQSHFLALKDHLTQEALSGSARAEDLNEQLRDIKSKYEGASAEVGKLRNQLRHNELLVQELRREDSRLRKENRRFQDELAVCEEDRERAERRAKEAMEQVGLSVTAEKFENMRCLLTNEVNEKSRSLTEAERELTLIREKLDSSQSEKKRSDSKWELMIKELEEVKIRNISLAREAEKLRTEKVLLQRQVEDLMGQMRNQHVPAQLHAETKRACEETIARLSQSLSDSEQSLRKAELEQKQLQEEKKTLREDIMRLQASSIPREEHDKMLQDMQSKITKLEMLLTEALRKCEEIESKARTFQSENTSMKESHVPLTTHHQTTTQLTTELEKCKAELATFKKQIESGTEELAALRAQLEKETTKRTALQAQLESETVAQAGLKSKLECSAAKQAKLQELVDRKAVEWTRLQTLLEKEITQKTDLQSLLNNLKVEVDTEYVKRKDHEAVVSGLQKQVEQKQQEWTQTNAKYHKAQDEVQKLQAAIQEQREELDTLHQCITEKYAPLTSMEEKERNFQTTRMELELELQEQCQISSETKIKLDEQQQEMQKMQKKLHSAECALNEERASWNQERNAMLRQLENLQSHLQEAQKSLAEAKEKERVLQDECQQAANRLKTLQETVNSQYVPIVQHQELKDLLSNTKASFEVELRTQVNLYENVQAQVKRLEKELEMIKGSSITVSLHAQEKATWEKNMVATQQKLQEKEEAAFVMEQEVKRLREEVQQAKHSLRELQICKDRENSDHQTLKLGLEQVIAQLEESCRMHGEESRRMAKELHAAQEHSERLRKKHGDIEHDIAQLKLKYDQSMNTVKELKERIQLSSRDMEGKDKEICTLHNDVEKLKLSLCQFTGGPGKNQSVEALQTQIRALQCQLDESQRRHQEIISIYRAHLLNAVQGHMDADVQDALLQIIHMRQELVC
ncbi:uveal autoantigen with coiled-coil domains and ankyrin repeats isoform X3 [Pelobates cultripes]|uniref:Uveal autoantigen with coiled-coil domains and ankyrin repeats isoform X3 n=1 Tax=Pelobates cultripes TaxID=61616 RepID=A0AAD1VZA2_PELCU|nr:uveal autoantigen with coiled-coil domains and ankyrin repeats isoform X3 [Pelobates cultripes]